MRKLGGMVLGLLGVSLADFGCRDRDETTTSSAEQDQDDTAGRAEGTVVRGTGAGGASGELDDPFGIGPRFCDLNPGIGGDACNGYFNNSGFFTEPEHLETQVGRLPTVRVWLATEFTPNTTLKRALEDGVRWIERDSESDLEFSASWVTKGLETSERARTTSVAAAFDLTPAQELVDGWYAVLIPRSARAALGAPYQGFAEPPLFRGGPFVELETGDLRADFHVGSLPFVSHVSLDATTATIVFSERVETARLAGPAGQGRAAPPPVTISSGGPALEQCNAQGWSGAARTLVVGCSQSLSREGAPVRIGFGEGLTSSEGAPLRGPGGATAFSLDVPAGSELGFEAPAPD